MVRHFKSQGITLVQLKQGEVSNFAKQTFVRLKQRVATLLAMAGVPGTVWSFALEQATKISNYSTFSRNVAPPYTRVTRLVPDVTEL